MMTDIVGFTEISRQDVGTIRAVGRKHKAILTESISRAGGEVIHIFGDGSLSLFSNAEEAVSCALEIQEKMQADPEIPLRIALHAGEVFLEGGEVYGESINLASRILKLGIARSILISDRMEAAIGTRAPVGRRSLGLFNLKYVDRMVEIFGIQHAGLRIPDTRTGEGREQVQSGSIAVMPFQNLGPREEDAYLGDGISEAIINGLARLPGVFVTARSSSFAMKKGERDVRELGRFLGVAYLLEGSVQKEAGRLRVTAQLIDTRNGFHLFSESFDRDLIDLFSIQEEIAWLIGQRLKEHIGRHTREHQETHRTSNVEALEYYMQARYLMARGEPGEVLRAIELYKKCITFDPSFVLPYAGISIAYTFLAAMRYLDEERANPKANAYALKAIAIDPELPEAMVTYALSSFWINNWNLKNAESMIAKAMRIAPGSAEIRLFNGMFILMAGNADRALLEVLLANKLDPLNPGILSRLGYTYLCLKDFEEAHNCFRLAHDTAPFAMYIQYILGWSYLLQGDFKRAAEALDRVDESRDVYQSVPGTRGYLYARTGQVDLAYEQIRRIGSMVEKGSIRFPHYNYALVYAGLERLDEMFHHLERAFREKPVHLMFIQADPFWEPFRKEMRFIQLVNRIFGRQSTARHVWIHADTREELGLQSDQILYIRAEDNYSRVVWIEEDRRKERVIRATLKNIEKQLGETELVRSHRSFLVNLSNYSVQGDSRGYRLVSALDPFVVPVSRSNAARILQRLRTT